MPAQKRAASKAKATAPAPKAKAAAAKAPAAKRQKVVDPLAKPIANAATGLRDTEVPAEVMQMLHVMLGPALSTCKEERHTYELSVVEMVGDLLTGAETRMAGSVSAAEQALRDLEDAKSTKQENLDNAEAVVEAKKAVELEKKRALAEDARVFKACKAGLADAEAARQAQAEILQKDRAKRDELATAQATWLKPLIAGTAGDETVAKELGDKLIEVLKRFDVDTSIISALPNVFAKPPASRGPFDTMVLAQLEVEMSKRVSGFDDKLREGEAAKARLVAAEQTAQHALARARAGQLASAEAFKAASADRQAAEAKRDEALCELVSIGPTARRTTKERSAAEKRLHGFRCGPLDAFLRLRDRTATQPEGDTVAAGAGDAAAEVADAAAEAADAAAEGDAAAPPSEPSPAADMETEM